MAVIAIDIRHNTKNAAIRAFPNFFQFIIYKNSRYCTPWELPRGLLPIGSGTQTRVTYYSPFFGLCFNSLML